MSNLLFIILFSFTVLCIGLPAPHNQESALQAKSESEEDIDKYDLESGHDFDRTSEKEKELKILRKAKKLKENNYRRALESILPIKNNESYRRLFEDLINDSEEKSKANSRKELEEVVVTDTFVEGEPTEGRDGEPEVDEIEVVIERITDNNNENGTSKKASEPESRNSEIPDSESPSLQEKPSTEGETESKNGEPPSENTNNENEERTGQDLSRSSEIDAFHIGQLAERRILEPYPISRFSEVVIPHYKTTLTRNGVVVTPALYTVQQTSAPIIDHVTSRTWIPNRRILPDILTRTNKFTRSELESKLIEDYNDYGGNAYSYSPMKSIYPPRQEILTKYADDNLAPQLGSVPLRENVNYYPGAYYPQPLRYHQENYNRPLFRMRR